MAAPKKAERESNNIYYIIYYYIYNIIYIIKLFNTFLSQRGNYQKKLIVICNNCKCKGFFLHSEGNVLYHFFIIKQREIKMLL